MIKELMKRNMVDKITADLNKGSLDALKKVVALSKRNTAEAGLFRFIARELKFEFLHDAKIKPSIEKEFYQLLDEMIASS
jgi:hypothetical protein